MQILPEFIHIYFLDKIIYLVENEQSILSSTPNKATQIVFVPTVEKLTQLLLDLKRNQIEQLVIVNEIEVSLQLLKQTFHFVRAAGGLVQNQSNELLCIFRRGKWDLPKGKWDDGETIEECAIREVKEETGILQADITEKCCITYHIYELDIMYFKQTDWFQMVAPKQVLLPQAEEGIDEARWLKKENMDVVIQNTYQSIIEVLQEGNWIV